MIKLKKCVPKIVMVVFILSLILGQGLMAQAKTLQTSIADPSNDTVVLNAVVGGVTLPYTWGDITGAAGCKFAGQAISDNYLAAEPHETCCGIKFADLLADIESTLGITLLDDYNIKTVCSDAYTNPAFTVAEAKNYDADHYLLAYKVDDTSEACIGYKDSDPTVTYPATYLRIARNRGGDYSDAFGRDAYMRLISSIQITKSDGSAIELANIDLAQNNGAGLSSLSPSAAGLVIGGTGITNGAGLLGNFIYLEQGQIDYIKANKHVNGLGLGSSWTGSPTLYSSYDNHGTPEYVYRLAEGINLKTALTALGADVTSAPVALEATSTDNYSKIVDDAFGITASRNYIAPDGTVGAAVDPLLVFYDDKVETSAPDSSTVVPTTTAAITNPNPLFVFGQKTATEQTNCSFIKNAVKIRAGLDTPAFTVTQDSTTKSISLSDIALLGIYQASYFWNNSGTPVTQSVKGVPLNALLTKLGITVPSGQGLIVNVNNGSEAVASSRTISYDEINKCFVAYDAFENSRRISGCITPLRIYCPGETQARVLIENVVGATVGEGQPFFEEMDRKTATELNKTWTIKLSQAVASETVKTQNIYVTDDSNETVNTTLSISEDLKSIAVTPATDYTPNKEYRLYISNQLQAKDSLKYLNKSLVMPFIIIP
ncbi:MAG: Ig-like domain-containing protein [Syntrophomonas sp.]